MKTLIQINKRIEELKETANNNGNELEAASYVPSKEDKKNGKELQFCIWVRNLLETNPSCEFLKSDKERLTKFIESKQEQFTFWKKSVAPKNLDLTQLKALYNKETGITDAKKKLKILVYILD